MNTLGRIGRSMVGLVVGGVCALIGFGLLLALAWLPQISENTVYKTVSLLVVTGVAVILGGYVSGWLAGRSGLSHGLALGLIVGLVAFGYVLGVDWLVLIAVLVTGLLGGTGGWLAERTRRPAAGPGPS